MKSDALIHRGLSAAICFAVASIVAQPAARAADEADDEVVEQHVPGLIARYIAADGVECRRIDPRVAQVWNERPPDCRISPGAFTCRWSGELLIQSPGVYQFRAVAAGEAKLAVDRQVILDGAATEPKWIDAKPIELAPGYHQFDVQYRKTGPRAQLALYWSGPQFDLEPLAERWLFHAAEKTPPGHFEEGAKLSRALRCAACHELPGEPVRMAAPALDRHSGNISREWLADWLLDTAHGGDKAAQAKGTTQSLRRMPSFGVKREEAEAIAAYLASPGGKPAAGKNAGKQASPAKGNPAAGALLANTLGCLACHRIGALGTDGDFGGGDLTAIARKRPPEFFARWLTNPEEFNRDHRMPVFRLEPKEVADLAAYLKTLSGPGGAGKKPGKSFAAEDAPAEVRTRGRTLVETYRCAACHATPSQTPAAPATTAPLKLAGKWEQSCLGDADAAKHRPGYRLSADRASALREYVEAARKLTSGAPTAIDGAAVLAERNCLACHARGQSPGIAPRLTKFAVIEPKLSEQIPFMSPPSLTDVGDKLPDAVLTTAITTAQPPRRPWLKIRMPKFPLSDAETKSLVQHLVATDRMPDPPQRQAPTSEPPALASAGARLVTSDGFGCTSCHAVGKSTPQKVPPGSMGPNLSDLGQRVRRTWYDRWMRDPARIVPRMEMPAVKLAARGVLADDVAQQLSAVWKVLNTPGFDPPAAGALRTVRCGNLPGTPERANVLTDVLQVDGQPFVKPLVIGLSNRHNLMFDLATNRLAAWWIGDTARERSGGKIWFWDLAGAPLFPVSKNAAGMTDVRLVVGGKQFDPTVRGQYPTEFDYFEHVAGGIRFGQRLKFGDPRATLLRVTQTVTALPSAAGEKSTGILRRVEIDGLPAGAAAQLSPLPIEPKSIVADGRSLVFSGPLGQFEVRLRQPERGRFEQAPGGARLALAASTTSAALCELEYRTAAAVDQFAPLVPPDRSVAKKNYDLVPGYEGLRLPVTDQAMPTGLAWRADGALVVSSLEGRVWLGSDTDKDGLVDRLIPWSDELAAPYGVAAHGDAVDVSTKFALLRLTDKDGDGRADRTEVLASGWGHTLDYHDWVAGPVADAKGNYYLSVVSHTQKDDPAERLMRGMVVRLTPREPTPDDPRPFAVENFCEGLRFAMGLAFNREGDLFATDNQGYYTPFNELNHLVQGAHYGFYGAETNVVFKPGQKLPFREAAIEIPHPWTRSVNGICFLHTPEAVRKKLGHDLFGPLEGHLIGCEYNNRLLARISLQRVGNTYQGAVYPFSADPAAGAEPFEGPLVCEVSPEGDLYVGNIRDSGWGGGSNTGSIIRLRPNGKLPPGIAEVRAVRQGFTIDFTAPVDRKQAMDKSRYTIASYRRIATPSYGGTDQDRRTETIQEIRPSPDARRVTLRLGNLRAGFVYEFRLANLAPAGQRFFPGEAHYTLRQLVDREAE